MHTLHLPPGHLVHATVVAALTAILAAVIVALAAERLAPSDTVVTSTEVRASVPAAPARATAPTWVTGPLAPVTPAPTQPR